MTRDSYFDILRGIAILLVIAIHTYPGGDFETAEGFVNICLRECCNVAEHHQQLSVVEKEKK